MVVVFGLMVTGAAFGQIRVVRPRDAQGQGIKPQRAAPFHDAEVENFLNNARDGVKEENWTYAIDSLQRIIDAPGDSLLSQDDQVYASGRRYAEQRIATLPAKALEVYRLLFDGQAKGLLEAARSSHDEGPLIDIVRRFKLTSYGDDAVDLLTAWMLDAGRAAETVSVLSGFLELYRDGDIPKSIFYSKLAIAYAMLHQPEAAATALEGIEDGEAVHRERIAAFIESEESGKHPSIEAKRWTKLLGGAGQNGRMPAVEPEFVSTLFQEHRFPKIRAKNINWDMLWDHAGRDPLQAPYYALTDGLQILVKGRGGIFSYDSHTFELLWEIDPPQFNVMAQGVGIRRAQLRLRQRGVLRTAKRKDPVSEELELLIRDEISAGLGIAHGIGFHIERLGSDIVVGSRAWNVRRNVRGKANETPGRNRLIAFDIGLSETGEGNRELWSLGRDEPTGHFLDKVAFASFPVEAGAHLLVVYRDQTSLMAAVLDPADGSLVRKIGLCHLAPGQTDINRAIRPTVAESTAYIPSEQGLLFAVDLVDDSIRWASRYPYSSASAIPQGTRGSRNRTPALSPAYPSSPPLVVGSMVIVTPTDSSEVVAFDRSTGRIRWSSPREPEQYLVAADEDQVWLAGGRMVTAIDVATGVPRWSEMLGRMTGRVAMSGDRLYVPLAGSLVAVRASDGHVLHEFELPDQQKPLGNLLCWDGAMYSTDMDGIRKLPDIKRSYQKTLAEYKADRTNPSVGLRLAWLELAQNKPKQAIDILQRVRLVSEENQRREGFKAHLTVQAYTQLAASEGDAKKAIASLQKAGAAAQSLEDRLTTQLSLAHRLNDAGRLLEAGKELATLVVSEVGDVVVTSEEGLTKSVRSWIKPRLSILAAKLEPDDKKALLGDFEKAYETARASKDRTLLRRLAVGSPIPELNQSAWLALADGSKEKHQIAQSEQYLQSAAELDGNRNLTAQALSGLAGIYLSEEVKAYDEAADVLRRMKEAYPAQRVMWDGQEMTGSTFAEQQMRRLPPEWPTAPPSTGGPALLGAVTKERWRLFSQQQGMAMFVSPNEHDKSGRIPVFVGRQTVRLMDVQTGEAIWSADLKHLHPDRWIDPDEKASPARPVQPTPAILFGETDGQTLAVYTTRGLYGVEMCSGRRLWARDLGTPTVAFVQHVVSPLSVKGGTIATLTDVNVVAVFDAADGAKRWERTVPGRTLTEVVANGPYVVALDEKWEEVIIFDAGTGKLVSFLSFAQPKRSGTKLDLLIYEDRIVGPHDDAVVCFEILGGKLLWRQAFKRAITGIFKPEKDRVGVGMVFGYVALLNTANGHRFFEARVKPAVKGIQTGVVEGDRLLVTGHREIGGILETCIASVSMSSRQPVWEVVGLNRTTIPQAHLRASSNVIPVVSLRGDPRVRVGSGGRPLAKLTLFDKMTGAETASYEMTTSSAPDDVLVRELRVYPGTIMISTDRTVRALSVNERAIDGGVN